MSLGERVVWARKRKGISQERLATAIGTTRRHMIRIEKGQTRRPNDSLIERIAEATGQEPSFFTADDEDEEESEGSVPADLLHALRVIRRYSGVPAA